MKESIFLALWERAADEEHGIAIATDSPREVSRHLYTTRQIHPRPEFQDIRVCFPNGGKEVWLVKTTVEILE